MKADQFYQLGQALGGLLNKQFGTGQMSEGQPQSPGGGVPNTPSWPSMAGQGGFFPEQQPQQPQTYRNADYDMGAAKAIIDQYVAAGYDPRFAVGQAANAIAESNLSTTAVGDNGTAYGLFQWRHDRLQGLHDYADRAGKGINDLNTHIEWSLMEYATAENAALKYIMGGGAESAEDYARLIDKYYERSDGRHREKRAALAGQLWRDFYGDGLTTAGDDTKGRTENLLDRLGFGGQKTAADFALSDRNERRAEDMMGFVPGMKEQRSDRNERRAEDMLGFIPGLAAPDNNRNEQRAEDMLGFIPGLSSPIEGQKSGTGARGVTGAAGGTTAPGAFTPSPTGGLPAGGSTAPGSNIPGLGQSSMAGGEGAIGGFTNIFTRREGESDASLADRRRNMLLNAAEGFQMLSRGVKADFNTPTQMRLNEKQRRVDNAYRDTEQVRDQFNADRNYGLQARQVAVQEAKLAMDQAAFVADRENDTQMRQQMGDMFKEAGYDDLATMAQNGLAQSAIDIYSAREEAKNPLLGDLAQYAVTDQAAQSAADYATMLGRPDLATQVMQEATPRARYDAYKAIMGLEPVDQNGGYVLNEQRYNDMVSRIPEKASTKQAEQLRNQARIASSLPDATTQNTAMQTFDEMLGKISAADPVMEARIEELATTGAEKANVASDLYQTGARMMDVASNPSYNPNQLKGQIIAPLARYFRGLGPAGEALAERLDVNDADTLGNVLLEAWKNGEIANLSKGINGQLSNLEGDRILSQLGDGKNERAETLALAQALMKGIEADNLATDAQINYLEGANRGDYAYSQSDMFEAEMTARQKVADFTFVNSETDRVQMQAAVINQAARRLGVDPNEWTSFEALPPEVRGMMIRLRKPGGGTELVPLFKDEFREYQE